MVGRIALLIDYRELVWSFVVRDLKVRYRNSVLGFLWCLCHPLLMMLIFTVVFTVLVPSQIRNFPVFVLAGILPWNFFSAAIVGSTGSVVDSGHLIRKVPFPAEVLPLAVVLSNLVNFLLALLPLFALLVATRTGLSVNLAYLPLIVAALAVFTAGLGLCLAALHVFYRDTLLILEAVLLGWFFLTPVFYPIELLPRHYPLLGFEWDVWRIMHIVNPMASLVTAFRTVVYNGQAPVIEFVLRTLATSVGILAIGYAVFVRFSRRFVEEL